MRNTRFKELALPVEHLAINTENLSFIMAWEPVNCKHWFIEGNLLAWKRKNFVSTYNECGKRMNYHKKKAKTEYCGWELFAQWHTETFYGSWASKWLHFLYIHYHIYPLKTPPSASYSSSSSISSTSSYSTDPIRSSTTLHSPNNNPSPSPLPPTPGIKRCNWLGYGLIYYWIILLTKR